MQSSEYDLHHRSAAQRMLGLEGAGAGLGPRRDLVTRAEFSGDRCSILIAIITPQNHTTARLRCSAVMRSIPVFCCLFLFVCCFCLFFMGGFCFLSDLFVFCFCHRGV